MSTTLQTLDDIKLYFSNNQQPYYFISSSNFNLMGMHEWVNGWTNINLIDCFDGNHPQVVVVTDPYSRVFEGVEDINHHLLNSDSVRDLIDKQANASDDKGKAVFLFFDEELERLCAEIGLTVVHPKNQMVRDIDSKIVTTEIGNQAGVSSVPNVLTKVGSYEELQRIATSANLGSDWVVQTPYGDSGKTTFFISNESDYLRVAKKVEAEQQVKVMRRVNCVGTAIEACATRWGTFVGPLLSELIGIESLTPYPGGWCGNELYPEAFTDEVRQQVQKNSQALGDALYQRGYRGYFELDYLIDLDTHEVYLGELNARITGISAMTNLSDFSASHIPLFLFHLLEYEEDVDLTLSVDEFNQMMLQQGSDGTSAQVILKYTQPHLQIVTQAPASGVYTIDSDDKLTLQRLSINRRDALAENEAYILRIMDTGEYAYKGGDLAIMFVNQVIRTDAGALNTDGEKWVTALKGCFAYRPLTQEERSLVELAHNPAQVKSAREQ